MEERQISSGFVGDAIAALQQRGIDPGSVLAQAGISGDAASEPVSQAQYGRLWLSIARHIDDEFFGLAARPMRPGSFVLLAHAVLNAGTLERALRRSLRFLDVVLESPRGTLRVHDGFADVVLTEADGPRPAFAYRTFWLLLMGLMCWLIGRRIALLQVDFACPAPPNRQDYLQFFGAPVHFGQPQSMLRFKSAYLSLPTVRDERALKTFLRGAPANILLRYRHDQGVGAPIREQLRGVAPDLWPDFDAMAKSLGYSAATLRRRLRSEGQSYSSIRDELRYAHARQLLRRSRVSVAEVASRLGYAEASAFHRAFLKWSGMTPGEFRRVA